MYMIQKPSSVKFTISHYPKSEILAEIGLYKGYFVYDPDYADLSVVYTKGDVYDYNLETNDSSKINYLKRTAEKYLHSYFYQKFHGYLPYSFKSESFQSTSDPNIFKLVGDLELRGKSKSVTIAVVRISSSPGSRTEMFKGTTTISRRYYGFNLNNYVEKVKMVSDEIRLEITLVGEKVW